MGNMKKITYISLVSAVLVILLICVTIGATVSYTASVETDTNQFLGCSKEPKICYDANVSASVWELLKTEKLVEIHYPVADFEVVRQFWRTLFVRRSVIVDGPEFERFSEKREEYINYNREVWGNSYWHIQNYTFFNIPFGKIETILVNHA